MKKFSLLLILAAVRLTAQIQLNINGIASGSNPGGPFGPFNVALVSTSPRVAVTVTFLAGPGTFEMKGDSQCTKTAASVTIQPADQPYQLQACVVNPQTGGSFYQFLTASAPGLFSVTSGWQINYSPTTSGISAGPANPAIMNGSVAPVSVTLNSGSYSGSTVSFGPAGSPTWLHESDNCTGIQPGKSCTAQLAIVNVGQLTPGQQYSSQVTFYGGQSFASSLVNYTPLPGVLTPSSASLNFSHRIEDVAVASQNLSVASSGPSLNVVATSSDNWLQVAPASAATPATFTVSINPSGLPPGQYAGNITLSAAGASNSPVIPVYLGVFSQPITKATQPWDFFGDGRANYVVWRPSNGNWFVESSSNPANGIMQPWGVPGDVPVPADYDGDGKADFAVWRPSNGTWYIIPSSNPGHIIVQPWGLSSDEPVPADYDGDGKADFAVWRPSNGTWYIIPSSNPGHIIVQPWGLSGDVALPADYDGDGKADFAVWRPSKGTWYVISSRNPGYAIVQPWGLSSDVPMPADYDGDGKADFAVWRPSNGTWYIIPSGDPGYYILQPWGLPGDLPVAADYDGDGKADLAVWRPSTGFWYVIPSSNSAHPILQWWGLPTDTIPEM